MTARRRPHGFTMGEILVVVAIIAILAATVIPTIKERMRTGYANAIAGELGNLAQGIQNYKATVGRYPLRLDYLDALPVTATDICAGTLLTPQRNAYVGPYITRVILASTTWYVIADDDSVDNNLWKNSVSTAGVPDVVWIDVLGVNATTANDLDLLIDGVANNGAGTLQYSSEASGDKDLKYMIPRKGC